MLSFQVCSRHWPLHRYLFNTGLISGQEEKISKVTNVSSTECVAFAHDLPQLTKKKQFRNNTDATFLYLTKFLLPHLSLRATQNYTALCKLVGVLDF